MSAVVHARARVRAALLLLAAGVCWGTGGLAGSVLVLRGGLHPLSVATYRLLLGGALVVLFLLATSGIRLRFTSLLARRLLAAGALLAVFQASYFAAVTLISVSIATMVTIGSVPVFVAVAGSISARRLPSATTVLTLGGAVLGLVLLTWSPVPCCCRSLTGSACRCRGGWMCSRRPGTSARSRPRSRMRLTFAVW